MRWGCLLAPEVFGRFETGKCHKFDFALKDILCYVNRSFRDIRVEAVASYCNSPKERFSVLLDQGGSSSSMGAKKWLYSGQVDLLMY